MREWRRLVEEDPVGPHEGLDRVAAGEVKVPLPVWLRLPSAQFPFQVWGMLNSPTATLPVGEMLGLFRMPGNAGFYC